MKRVILAGLLLLSVIPVGAMASIRGSPKLDVSLADKKVTPGEETRLQFTLTNEGIVETGSSRHPSLSQTVTTARGIDATLDASGAPIKIETGTQSLGQLQQGGQATLGYDIIVNEQATPGTYRVSLTVEYRYTSRIIESTGGRSHETETKEFDVTIEIDDRAAFEIAEVQTDARIGATDTVTLTMENVGTEAANATAIKLESQNTALTIDKATSSSRFIGHWEPGESHTLSYQVTIGPEAAQQRYTFSATATFEDEDGIQRQSDPLTFGIIPNAEQTFTIVNVTNDVRVGQQGTVSVTLRNTGPITVHDAVVQLTSSNSDLRVSETVNATRFVGDWKPGETQTVSYDVTATEQAESHRYPMTTEIIYRDDSNDRGRYRVGTVNVTPVPEQTFAYRNISVQLRGSTIRVSGEVVNTGDQLIESALLTTESVGARVHVTDGTYPVGTLPAGETAPFTLELQVDPNTYPGPRRLGMAVQYDTPSGRTYTSDITSIQIPVQTDEDLFAVSPVNTTLAIDTDNTVRVRIRNVGDHRLTEIRARLAIQPPYQSHNPTAYVASLDPGESTTVTFEVTTPEDGVPTTDAIPINVTAESSQDYRFVSGPYLVPITIIKSKGTVQGNPFLVVGTIAIAVLIGGWWWANR